MSKDDDSDTLGRRLTRYARVTTTMGGLAAKLAGEKFLGMPVERGPHAAALKHALGGLKGPLMKVAQILSTIPGALPEEYAEELAQLQANAPPMGWLFVKRRMSSELGPDWRAKFSAFEQEAAAAASLGQVHRAKTLAGQDIACKLQYPDMQSAVEADLRQLKLVFGLFESYNRAISTKQIHEELSARLREELNYTLEAKHMSLYRLMLADEQAVSVPNFIPELSTERLLTMEWLEGRPIMNFVDHDSQTRDQLATTMFRAWYRPFYQYGIIHGDPHLGNYTVRNDLGINLLDFGCIRVFPPRFVQGVIDLYHALETDNAELAVHAYESWGFKTMTRELLDVLNVWARFLYAPLLDDRKRLIGETSHGIYGRETAEKVHKDLRRLGQVEVPREFVFMDRAALGLGSAFLHLQAEINWHRLFNELIADFSTASMEKNQSSVTAILH